MKGIVIDHFESSCHGSSFRKDLLEKSITNLSADFSEVSDKDKDQALTMLARIIIMVIGR